MLAEIQKEAVTDSCVSGEACGNLYPPRLVPLCDGGDLASRWEFYMTALGEKLGAPEKRVLEHLM